MKKIFFSFLAIAALASCAKTEAVFTQDNSEIKIAPVTSMATKTVLTGTEYEGNFNVYAYWANQPAGSDFIQDETGTDAGAYLSNVKFINKGLYWGGETTYYWPKNGSLRFAAYSPAESASFAHILETDTYMGTFTQKTNPAETVDLLLAPTTTSYTAQTAVQNVSVKFQHALSWITVKVAAKDAESAAAFKINDVTIKDVVYKANLNASMNDGIIANNEWVLTNDKFDYVVNSNQGVEITTVAKEIEDADQNGLVFIPQAPTSIEVEFIQNTLGNVEQTLELPLSLEANAEWEAGKHYIYTIVFGLDEILLNPSVNEWEVNEVPVIDATAVQVSNSEELVNAVAAGRSVRLTSDIELDAPVIIDPTTFATKAQPSETLNVTVDLNGKTITAPLFAESNGTISAGDTDSYGFWVKKGATLTINGPGKVLTQACDYSIAVWADGGEVIINGGEFENAGEGSDLIYAKNGGKVTINGGEFTACEKKAGVDGTNEKRSALNLHDNTANNEIKVYGGSFFEFNPANNKSENPAVSFVAAGHNVIESEGWYTVTNVTADVVLNAETVVYGSLKLQDASLNGVNNTLTVQTVPVDNGMIRPVGNVMIQNLNINGNNAKTAADAGIRGIYVSGKKPGNYVVENVKIENCAYAINLQPSKGTPISTLEVTNSTLEGWTSYNSLVTATFTNVRFTVGDFYGNDNTNYSANDNGLFRPYGTTVLYNCSFAEGFSIDLGSLAAGESIVFDSCTYAGQPLTAANLAGAEGKAYTIR